MDAFEAVSLPESSAVPGKNYFSLSEANRALALVRRIVADVVRDYRKLHALRDACRTYDARGRQNKAEQARQEYVALTDHLAELKEELETIGCELKDFRMGLVDFPSWRDGREVCLCWRHGEDRVTHWHELDVGFAGRQPIAADPA